MPWGVSIEKRFIFIHIPKTAGCAICAFLKGYMEVGSNHSTIAEAETWCKAHQVEVPWEAFKAFAVIRNPYDRFALGYFFERGRRVQREVSEAEIERLVDGGNLALRTQKSWVDEKCRLLKFETLAVNLNGFLREVGIPLDAREMPVVHKIVAEEIFDDYFTERDKRIIRNVYEEDFRLWEDFKWMG